MVAAKSLVVGILVASISGSLTVKAGEIISAGAGSREVFERQVPAFDRPIQSIRAGNFIQAGTFNQVGTTFPAAPSARTYVMPLAPATVPAAARSVPPAQVLPMVAMPEVAIPEAAAATFVTSAAPVAFVPPVPAPTTPYDAFVNFGNAPMSGLGTLANGTLQPWYTSNAVTKAYGGVPNDQQIHDFGKIVIDRVAATFARSGLQIRVTDDASAPSAHMLSVASGVSATSNPDAIGIATIGRDGFSFIDKLAYAQSPDELLWAVTHNVAHELMHTFGGGHHTTAEGNNLDAAITDWSVLVDPNTKFSAEAVAEMNRGLQAGRLAAGAGQMAHEMMHASRCHCTQCQVLHINGVPVPEPATMMLWGGVASLAALVRLKNRKKLEA